MPARLELHLIDESDGLPVPDTAIKIDAGDVTFSETSNSAGVALIEMPVVPRHLCLHVNKKGFVPKLLVWDLKTLRLPFPDQFTLKMERARTIGGFVRNKLGEPVEGANVLVTLRGMSPPGEQPRRHNEIWEQPTPTDAEGRWHFDEAPADLAYISLRLEHPDYVSNEHIRTLPPADDFKNRTAVLTALKGIPCEGTVTDEQGRPLENVKVLFGQAGADSTSGPFRKTDSQGRYRFAAIPLKHTKGALILSFHKKGFSPEVVELQLASPVIRKDVVLRPGKSLRVRVVDAEGHPVQGAIMAMSYWREHRPFHRRFEADETGLAVWENAPHETVGFWFLREGFERNEVQLLASDEIQTVVLQRPTKISGRVIDARIKAPIPKFGLIRGTYFSERSNWSHWNHSYIYNYTNGEFQCSGGDPVIMRGGANRPAEAGFRRLRIEAAGYKPAISRPIANDEETVELIFELEPDDAVGGIVRDPEGRPASGVQIAVVGSGNPMTVHNGRVHARGGFLVATDEEGRYILPPQEEDFPVVLAHPAAGYFVTSCSALKAAPDVQLRAWGSLELISAGPAEYQLQPVLDQANREDRVRFFSDPVAGANGVLIFSSLPAGPMRFISHGMQTRTGSHIVIEEGKTARVDLRKDHWIVVGQILLPTGPILTEEPFAHLGLTKRQPPPPVPPNLNSEESKIWMQNWFATPEGKAFRAESFHTSFEIDSKGKFRIHDIVPGSYRLNANFFRSLPRQQNAQADFIGKVLKDFDLPEGEGEFDLGVLPLTPPGDIRWGSK